MASLTRQESWFFFRLSDLYSQKYYEFLNIYIPFVYYDFVEDSILWELRYFDHVQRFWSLDITQLNVRYENEVIRISYRIDPQLPNLQPIELRFDYYYAFQGECVDGEPNPTGEFLPEIGNDIVFEFCRTPEDTPPIPDGDTPPIPFNA